MGERGACRGEAPILCRGFGTPEPEGRLGSCPRLRDVAWCPARSREHILAAASASGSAFLFDVSQCDAAFPRRCLPLFEVQPPPPAGPISGRVKGQALDLM